MNNYRRQGLMWDISNLESRLKALAPLLDSEDESVAESAYIESDDITNEIKALERQIEQSDSEREPT